MFFSLRKKIWEEDGLFETVVTPFIITDDDDDEDDDDDDDEGDFDDRQLEEGEFNFDDIVPYGADEWQLEDDGIDLEGPQFANENELYFEMEQGPPPCKRRKEVIPIS